MVSTAVLDKDENILNKEVQKRRAGHFQEVLNRDNQPHRISRGGAI